ncbi:MAG: hypothetical protein V2A34_05445 [Lentisphaerota bacterium]
MWKSGRVDGPGSLMNKVVFEPMIIAWFEKLILLLLNVLIEPETGLEPIRMNKVCPETLKPASGPYGQELGRKFLVMPACGMAPHFPAG